MEFKIYKLMYSLLTLALVKIKIFTEVKFQTITYLISRACWVLASARMTEILERYLTSIRYIFLKLTPLPVHQPGEKDNALERKRVIQVNE